MENTYIHKTIYWVSKELTHGHNDAWCKEDEHRDLSVKPEHKIVNTYLAKNFFLVSIKSTHFVVEVGVMFNGIEGRTHKAQLHPHFWTHLWSRGELRVSMCYKATELLSGRCQKPA